MDENEEILSRDLTVTRRTSGHAMCSAIASSFSFFLFLLLNFLQFFYSNPQPINSQASKTQSIQFLLGYQASLRGHIQFFHSNPQPLHHQPSRSHNMSPVQLLLSILNFSFKPVTSSLPGKRQGSHDMSNFFFMSSISSNPQPLHYQPITRHVQHPTSS